VNKYMSMIVRCCSFLYTHSFEERET